MKSLKPSPLVKHLVLVGGGHSHLAVLRHLGMHPVPGLAVTLISKDINTPYSGSLPGMISGFSERDDIHIDLRPLAIFAGARIIQASVENIDLERKRIKCGERPDIEFDLLSLNIGSQPDAIKIPGAEQHSIGIKPIDRFLVEWDDILAEALDTLGKPGLKFDIAIVGGGPASVEFALAAQYRIHKKLGIKISKPSGLSIKIVTADSGVLGMHNNNVRHHVNSELNRRSIEVLSGHRASEFKAGTIVCERQGEVSANVIVLATGASIPQWPADCGLAIGDDGFIAVNSFLQSTSHDFVFAAGDAATMEGEPRPKSGVYAVRHGKPLAKNLLRYATGKKLTPFKPQKHALALISLGNKTAIASRNKLSFHGRSIWELKQKIDGSFLKKYSEFPQMELSLDLAAGLTDAATAKMLQAHAMRCAGCGAKVGSSALAQVLEQLPVLEKDDIIRAATAAEDASQIKLDDERILLQSVDQIKAFIDDPWLFARIATNHCLSDIYAMGSTPHSALAIVGLPFAAKQLSRTMLNEIMQGCTMELNDNGCSLIGGHTAEATELSFGLSVNGFSNPEGLLKKDGMQVGDVLILSKPLGTGTLLAADMRYKAKHSWIKPALEHMLKSNRQAAEIFVSNKASACTDITGFGLAGHMLEMLESEDLEVEISLEDIPAMDGALKTLELEIFSSLHEDNKLISDHIYNSEAFPNDPRYELLFDPQTAGGLLASVSESQVESCLEALKASGHPNACVIGRVSNRGATSPSIILK